MPARPRRTQAQPPPKLMSAWCGSASNSPRTAPARTSVPRRSADWYAGTAYVTGDSPMAMLRKPIWPVADEIAQALERRLGAGGVRPAPRLHERDERGGERLEEDLDDGAVRGGGEREGERAQRARQHLAPPRAAEAAGGEEDEERGQPGGGEAEQRRVPGGIWGMRAAYGVTSMRAGDMGVTSRRDVGSRRRRSRTAARAWPSGVPCRRASRRGSSAGRSRRRG